MCVIVPPVTFNARNERHAYAGTMPVSLVTLVIAKDLFLVEARQPLPISHVHLLWTCEG